MNIAPALVLLAVVATSPPPNVPTVLPDSIWGKGGFIEHVNYSTTRPGRPHAYESSIEVERGSGRDPDSGPEKLPEMERGEKILMIFWSEQASGKDSVQEYVGVTFQLDLTPLAGSSDYGPQWRSWRSVVPPQGEILYDGLPVWLRGFDLTKASTLSLPMYPTMLTDDSTKANPVAAKIQILGPAGPPSETSHGGLEVDVRYAGKIDRLWFHPGPGHVMLVWEKADGTTLTYRKSERR